MAGVTNAHSIDAGSRDPPVVDPRAPRFGQTITASGLVLGIVLGIPALVFAVTAILLTAVVTRWRVDPYAIIWRRIVHPAIGPPADPEPAAPHRFAKLLGATGTTVASGLLVLGVPTVGYAIAGLVAIAAGLAALTGLCLGCKLYRQVAFFRRYSIV